MNYKGTLISVSNMEKSKTFYEKIMQQKIVMDLGTHVSFENGLSLQSDYEELVGVKLPARIKPNNFQLYFEVGDLPYWEEKIKSIKDIEFIHESKEYPWGQHVMHFYDYDKYIVEVSESMESVAKRYLKQGLSAEETAQRTMFPIEYIEQLKYSLLLYPASSFKLHFA